MWIAENMAKNRSDNGACTSAAVSSSGDSELTAIGRDGVSHLTIAAPSGISFSPKIDENAVVVKTENGDVCIGTIMRSTGITDCPRPGELFLSNGSGTAYIKLMSNGSIVINGDVTVNGNAI